MPSPCYAADPGSNTGGQEMTKQIDHFLNFFRFQILWICRVANDVAKISQTAIKVSSRKATSITKPWEDWKMQDLSRAVEGHESESIDKSSMLLMRRTRNKYTYIYTYFGHPVLGFTLRPNKLTINKKKTFYRWPH